jgi:YVTN family beta-propeller protein
LVRHALELWRGPALAEFASEPFAQSEIGRLEDLRVSAIEECVDADLALGRHADLIGELEAVVAEHPHRERLRGQLMLALYRSGRQAEALEAYRDARRALVDELGIDPGAALQQLEKAILVHDEELGTPARPEKVVGPIPARATRRRLLSTGTLLAAGIAGGVVLLTRHFSVVPLVPVNAVGIIDPKTKKVVGHVPVGSTPGPVAVGLHGVWVANLGDRTLSRIDLKTRTVVRTISLNATPTGVAVGARAVWVAYGLLGTLSRVAPQYNQVSKTIQAPVGPFGRARGVAAVGAGSVWVAYGDSSVFRIDPTSMHVVFTTFAGNSPSAVAFGIGSLWVVNAENSTVTRFNPPTYGVATTISVGRLPSGVAVGGGSVWVTDEAGDAVSRIDPVTNSVTTIPVGRAPVGIAYGAGAVWVANSGDGSVSRIVPSSNTVVATIRVGNSPSGIAFGAGAVWVTVQSVARAT